MYSEVRQIHTTTTTTASRRQRVQGGEEEERDAKFGDYAPRLLQQRRNLIGETLNVDHDDGGGTTSTSTSTVSSSSSGGGAATTRNHHDAEDMVPAPSLSLSNKKQPRPPSRVLLGIFSTQSPADIVRRNLIRRSYLSTYKILNEVGLAEQNESTDRLCSLSDLMEEKRATVEECLIVYTFVLGAWDRTNTSAPTDLTQLSDPSISYTVDRSIILNDSHSHSHHHYEEDALYLNIRENMNHGKSDTWFRYASTILPAEDLGIDVIAKVDTDTVVFPKAFLEDLNQELLKQHGIQERPATSLYGGLSEVAHPNELPYMQGGFYFLSRDVAQYITSDHCPRDTIVKEITQPILRGHDVGIDRAEDLEIGSFVDQCWRRMSKSSSRHHRQLRGGDQEEQGVERNTAGMQQQEDEEKLPRPRIRKLFLKENVSASHQPAWKKADRFRVMWKDGRAKQLATLRLQQIQGKYPNGCPQSPQQWQEELNWFDNRPYMIQAKEHFSRIC